jgi:hypothetical protein
MARAVSSLIVGLLLCVACPAVEAKDVGQLNLNKFLKGFWGCEISTGQVPWAPGAPI